MSLRTWTIFGLWVWIIVASGAFAGVYGLDLLRRARRGIRPTQLAVYVVTINACLALILIAALVDQITGRDLSTFRAFVMLGVAIATTHGLTLLLRYRRR